MIGLALGLAACIPSAFATGQAPARTGPPLDEGRIARARFGADADWYAGAIPFFDSADPTLNAIYYYRWKVFRAHQRDLGALGYITTEFLDDVGWQRQPYASLNDATAMHIYEGRWLRDRRYADDYIDYMYSHGGNDRHFSESIADAVYAHYLVDGDADFALSQLSSMERIYQQWNDHYDTKRRLYWIEPLLDATEYTIASIDASGGRDGFTGGQAFRPSINSFMYANARAIARLAALKGDTATASLYDRRADDLRRAVQSSLWSADFQHFIDRYKVDNAFVRAWSPIRGRELVGYLPWYAELPEDTATYAQSWRHLLSPAELAGPFGLRTNEPSHPEYMRQYRYDKATGGRECQWNGPAWPFQTTQALVAMANLLNDYPHQDVVSRSDYMRLLRQYACLHLSAGRDQRPDLQEDYDPDTGKVIVGLPRSHHYNHSGFDDLIVTGLVGLRPRADDVLEVDPLVPANPRDPQFLPYFALQDAPYHGHLVSVVFDVDGQRYGRGAGLSVYVDGQRVAVSPHLGKLTARVAQAPIAPVQRPVDLAASLVRTGFPKATASYNTDPTALHQAIDGRVMFFPEAPNGWSTLGSPHDQDWYEVDFGHTVQLTRAELSFFGDPDRFAAPEALWVQVWRDGGWRDVAALSHP
ncbi:MAG: amylo-alpha-1,6-glucosidase, partial [Caulobacteraceae bacterium]